MKFLLEFIGCWGSCSSSSMVKEEASLLVASVPPPPKTCSISGHKRGRAGRNSGGSGAEWRPSLSSIHEDNLLHEGNKNEHREEVAVVRSSSSSSPSSDRNLKRKTTSTPRARSYSSREDVGRPAVHVVMPTFSPAPFMF